MNTNKIVLVVCYSQSGQLTKIAENFVTPLLEKGILIEWLFIKPKNEFPFPWSAKVFFNAMPESVMGIPAELESPVFKHAHYDLIILCYQPWFLSPSIPATSIMHHNEFKKRLINTPVVTLIGSRNMWITAQEKLKNLLLKAQANLVGNVVLTDRHNNFVSAVTIQYWMFTGKRDKFLGLFPRPGINEKDVADANIFGKEILRSLENQNWDDLQERLINLKAVEVNSNLMFIESRASKLFMIWAKLILKKRNRDLWTRMFKYYLLIALFIVAPIVLVFYNILFKPFLLKQISNRKVYYSGVTKS